MYMYPGLSGVYGFCISANYSLTSPILVDLVSIERFSTAYGFLLASQVVTTPYVITRANLIPSSTVHKYNLFYILYIFYKFYSRILFTFAGRGKPGGTSFRGLAV